MKLIDESFFQPRTPVAVIDCGATGEALLVRGLLENMNAVVMLHQPGAPSDFLLLLADGDRAPRFIVICAHGDENGIILGSFASNIDSSVLIDGVLPPTALSGRVNLPGCVVLSTACGTGIDKFAAPFLEGGVSAYVAASEYPEATDVLLFVHHFFHEVLCRGLSPQSAFARASSYDRASERFALHAPEC